MELSLNKIYFREYMRRGDPFLMLKYPLSHEVLSFKHICKVVGFL